MLETIVAVGFVVDGQVIQSSPRTRPGTRGVTTREWKSERIRFWKRRPGLAAETDLRGGGAEVVPQPGVVVAVPGGSVEVAVGYY